ncbi:MAG: ABC transporter permease [Anaerolineae bacterium]|nr:ABC transporter permease [Anaerolineae bacterium]
MKILDIALKDILRSLRNYFFLGFGLGVPVLMGVIFYFAFGGLASEDGFEIARVDVLIVNLDEPLAEYDGFSAGKMLADFLQSEELAGLLAATEADSAADARAAVDNQEAGVAVIIPAGLSAAAFDPQGKAEVEIYHDPTLTIGPGIVTSIVTQFMDTLVGSKIAAGVAYDQLTAQGATADTLVLQNVAMQYGEWSAALAESQGANALLDIRSPAGREEEEGNLALEMVGGVMTGMMVFYAFYTGAASAMGILQEEQDGTLPRLLTTPTPSSAILGGKLIAVFALVIVQVIVLMAFSSLIFKTEWGAPGPLAMAVVGLVVLAASFGIFVMSWLKDTKQAGVVIGGVMTVLGMVGISSVFTANVPGAAGGLTEILPLFVPQGWAMRAWRLAIEGGAVGDVLLPFGVMLVLGAAFFAVGVLKFKKRFV